VAGKRPRPPVFHKNSIPLNISLSYQVADTQTCQRRPFKKRQKPRYRLTSFNLSVSDSTAAVSCKQTCTQLCIVCSTHIMYKSSKPPFQLYTSVPTPIVMHASVHVTLQVPRHVSSARKRETDRSKPRRRSRQQSTSASLICSVKNCSCNKTIKNAHENAADCISDDANSIEMKAHVYKYYGDYRVRSCYHTENHVEDDNQNRNVDIKQV
jgi:hypothetical protein